MSGEIIVDNIRDGESRSEKTDLSGMIILEQSGVKTSVEKRGISDQIKNITEREKSHSKREKKM